jgi:hypothetical protein
VGQHIDTLHNNKTSQQQFNGSISQTITLVLFEKKSQEFPMMIISLVKMIINT